MEASDSSKCPLQEADGTGEIVSSEDANFDARLAGDGRRTPFCSDHGQAAGGRHGCAAPPVPRADDPDGHARPHHTALSRIDRKSTRLNSSHLGISYAVF